MRTALTVIQIVAATTLIFLVLIQTKGAGLSKSVASVSFARRGLEKIVFKSTFVIASIFILVSIIQLFL